MRSESWPVAPTAPAAAAASVPRVSSPAAARGVEQFGGALRQQRHIGHAAFALAVQAARQVVEIAIDGAAQEHQRHGVAVVVQQQVQHLREARGAQVSRTVDRRAVADVEQPLHGFGTRGMVAGRAGASGCWPRTACARAAAEPHEPPALVVHHVFFGKSGERGQRQQHAFIDFAAAAARGHGLLHLALQSDHAAPVTRRQPVAHLRGAPGEVPHVGLQPRRIARAQGVEDFLFGAIPRRDRGISAARDATPARRCARPASAAAGARCSRAYRVASQPDRDFRPAARGCSPGAGSGRLPVCTEAAGSSWRPAGFGSQHPDVLGAAAALRGNHVGGRFVGDARQAAGQ